MKRLGFVLAGTHSGVGKTTLTLALLKALVNRGVFVQSYKVGPDFIDPRFHEVVTGIPAYNLDSCLLGDERMAQVYDASLKEGALAVVEGVMGLYDGLGTRHENGSTAWIARLLELPVILVIDGGGMSTSAAALVRGYCDYDPAVQIAGVIVNRISSDKHYRLIREAVERDTGIPCLGWMPEQKSFHLSSRHLGLIPAVEVPDLLDQIESMAHAAAQTVELNRLPGVADVSHDRYSNQPESPDRFSDSPSHYPAAQWQVGIAYDAAFHFYYQSNLDWLRHQGCRLVPVSPMKDSELPETLDALYIGGGFPEMFAETLQNNETFRKDLKSRILDGLPVYAECGGFQYLCESLTDFDGNTYQMTGALPGRSRMTGQLQHFGYSKISTLPGSRFFPQRVTIRGHEFHRGIVETSSTPVLAITKQTMDRQTGIEAGWSCGLETANTFGAFPHVFFDSNPAYAAAWLSKIPGYSMKLPPGE